MPFTERTSEKLHLMLITDEEQQEKACVVSFCPSSRIENRSPREKCGPSFFEKKMYATSRVGFNVCVPYTPKGQRIQLEKCTRRFEYADP